jgi:HAD superfamily hydrolase (TIGR01509 family)
MPFTRPVAGVIFDMDGLLVDTERVYLNGLLKAAAAVDREMTAAFAHSMIGVPGKECIAMIEDHYGPGFDMDAFSAVYDQIVARRLAEDIPLRPGARELVTYLSDEGIPQAIATSSRRPTVERYMTNVGLLEHFAAIVSREDVANAKPAPDPFLIAAKRLGLAPPECLALEDSYHGITAAHAAGTMPIMVPDLLAATDVMRAKCIAVVDDLHAVWALLQRARSSSATVAAAASS